MPIDRLFNFNQINLHVSDWGGRPNAQPVLLVHGLASNAKIWNYVAPQLAAAFQVAALDQRSHGLSPAPAHPDYSFAAVCRDIREVCARLKFTRPVIVGHSWGGGVALEYAARYPEDVAGVVMIDGGFIGINKRMTWPEAEERLAPPRLAGTPLAEFRERVGSGLGNLFNEAVFDIILGNFEVRADQTLYPHLTFENHMQIVRAMWEQDAEKVYRQVKCPALFLPCVPAEPHEPGVAQFLTWKRESVEAIRRLMPQAQVDWLTDSIHDVPLQKPELVAKKLQAFGESLGSAATY